MTIRCRPPEPDSASVTPAHLTTRHSACSPKESKLSRAPIPCCNTSSVCQREKMMAATGDDYEYAYYGPLVAVVLGLVIAGPVFLAEDGGEAAKEALTELLGPVGMFLLPVSLIILIRVLSSDRRRGAAEFFAFFVGGRPDSVHHVGGSPVRVALFLLLIVVLLYYRVTLFGGDDGGDDE
jgi:hypothetical protein